MRPIVVVIAAGEMGAAVGVRLRENGAEVRTSLVGRSAKTAERARHHGLTVVNDDAELVAGADLVLSIARPWRRFRSPEGLRPRSRRARRSRSMSNARL